MQGNCGTGIDMRGDCGTGTVMQINCGTGGESVEFKRYRYKDTVMERYLQRIQVLSGIRTIMQGKCGTGTDI